MYMIHIKYHPTYAYGPPEHNMKFTFISYRNGVKSEGVIGKKTLYENLLINKVVSSYGDQVRIGRSYINNT